MPINKETLQSLKSYSQQISYCAGTFLVHRGEPGTAFYIIVSGYVEIILGQNNNRLCLARLGEGDSFGEMSLLTNVPVSADAVAETDVEMLIIPAERFQGALDVSAPLRNHIFARLCDNLRHTSSEAWDLFQHTKALGSLMNIKDNNESIVARSTVMARLLVQMDQLPLKPSPILVTGETGTGKFFLARKIHHHTTKKNDPLIVVDCQQFDEKQANRILFGTDQVKNFIHRDSQQNDSELKIKGALHLADKGSLILRHIESLEPSAQKNLCFYLDTIAESDDIFPMTRILATTSSDLNTLASAGKFDPQLAARLFTDVLEMPPLRKRKRDLLSLAKLFLTAVCKANNRPALEFSKSAEHAVLSAQYQHRNVAELREAVELSTTFAEKGQVEAEYIFTGPKSQGHSLEYDLTRKRSVQWLTKRSSLRLFQGVLLFIFSAIIVLCFTADNTLIGRIANMLVWAAWWPSLMLLFLFIGRLWCTVCPISTAGRIAKLIGSLKLAPPEWIKNYAGWIMALLFLIIIGAEHAFHMTNTPVATGILLLSLMCLPIIFGLIFQRETWCRYLCPLGSLAAGYSIVSTVNVHSNPNVCASQCTTHECFKGSKTEMGCPVFHHPLYARDAHICKLCFTCLRSCPHQSARLYLHPPLMNLWHLSELGNALIPFALVVFFLSIMMLLPDKFLWFADAGNFAVLVGLSIILAAVFKIALTKIFVKAKDSALIARIAFAMLILAWGPFMAFHLSNIPELNVILIRTADKSVLAPVLNTFPISLLLILQFAVIMFAAFCTGICLSRIKAIQQDYKGKKSNLLPWVLIFAVCGVYTLIAVVLILPVGISII